MNDIDKLVHFYNETKIGDVYHDAVGLLLNHLNELEGLTIYEMAELCFVSPTTLSRLSKKLGFVNFSDFKNNLIGAVRGYSAINRSMPYTPTKNTAETMLLYNQTVQSLIKRCHKALNPEYIDAIVTEMAGYDNVHFISNTPSTQTIFQQDLIMSGKQCLYISHWIQGMEIAKTLDTRTFVISVIPKTPDSVEMIAVLKAIKKTGASTLIISSAVRSSYDKYADYLISFEGTGSAVDIYALIYIQNVITMTYRTKYID